MENIYERFGLTRVINARGPATIIGGARVSRTVSEDVREILGQSVQMWELQKRASEEISLLTGAQAGCVVNCTAAGIVVAAAACLTEGSIAKIKRLPMINWEKKKIVLQKGHVTGAGDAPIHRLLATTGAEIVEVGEATDCTAEYLDYELDAQTAAAVYVMGEFFPPNLLDVETFIRTCKRKQVPVIVDAAYVTDFRYLIRLGADLTVHSVHKWLAGPTAAIIAGNRNLVHSCYLQELGLGRPMKAGKESVLGAISAIRNWRGRDWEKTREQQQAVAASLIAKLSDIRGIHCETAQSEFTPSLRVILHVDEKQTGISAETLNGLLMLSDPMVKLEDYLVKQGTLIFDLSYLEPGEEEIAAGVIIGILQNPNAAEKKSAAQPKTRQETLLDFIEQWNEF